MKTKEKIFGINVNEWWPFKVWLLTGCICAVVYYLSYVIID